MVSSKDLEFKGHGLWHAVQSDSTLIFCHADIFDLQPEPQVGSETW